MGYIEWNRKSENACACVPDDRSTEPACRDVRLGRYDAFGELGNRHADIACNRLGAGPQRERRPIGVMPGLPQPGAILRFGSPLEWAAAEVCRDLAETR